MQQPHALEVRDFTVRTPAAPRSWYGEALLAAAQHDPRIVCLTADLTTSTETNLFRDRFPDRFFQAGIAEANMIGVAGGMARAGDIPFVHSFSVFVTRRCYDQVAMQMAYPRLPVKIVGMLPGLTTNLGVSHQAIDDIALMRSLPNMMVIEPSHPGQVAAAVEAALGYDGPVYLRMRRMSGTSARTDEPALDSVALLRDGDDGLIVACGLMIDIALQAAEVLADEGVSVAVAELATIKPVAPELAALVRRFPVVVTAENHSIIGGLGSAVAEVVAETGAGCRFGRIGVQDCFAEGGTTPYLFQQYGLDVPSVVAAIRRVRDRHA